MNKKSYDGYVKKLIQEGGTGKACACCGEDESLILHKAEDHHIFGLANSSDTALLCSNCHTFVTQKQNQLSPKRRSKKASKEALLAYAFYSMCALLERLGKQGQKLVLDFFDS